MIGSSKIIGAVEIGSSKVAVLVGEIICGDSLNIIGLGESPSRGVKKGEIVDFKAASEATHDALARAEQASGTSIDEAYLSQSGAHLRGFLNTATVNVSASNGAVSSSDLARANQEAKAKQLSDNRVYLHHIHNGYQLDGRPVEHPLGMDGSKLSLAYWSIHADTQKIKDHIHVVNAFGLKVEEVIVSGLASSIMVTSEDERLQGVLVIDFGSGTTDYVLYQKGFICASGSIPVGGDHVTNDVSLGLRISRKQAESLKIEFGHCQTRPEDQEEKVWLIGDKMIGDRHLPKGAINQIIEARMSELLALIREELGDRWNPKLSPAGIVITGGASLLPGLDETVERVFEQTTHYGLAPSWVREDLTAPSYSTVLGLLHYALTGQTRYQTRTHQRKNGLWNRMAKIFN
jgi:cell division protein FtsA